MYIWVSACVPTLDEILYMYAYVQTYIYICFGNCNSLEAHIFSTWNIIYTVHTYICLGNGTS